jgi:transposase
MDTEHSAITEPVRRIEVFTGTGRRRTWSFEDKARIVAESVTSGESVCAVARRHGLSPQQLFGWRRQIRQPATASTETAAALFVPAVVEAGLPERVVRRRSRNRPRQVDRSSWIIEVEIDGVTVRVGRGAEAKTVAAVLRALKAGA